MKRIRVTFFAFIAVALGSLSGALTYLHTVGFFSIKLGSVLSRRSTQHVKQTLPPHRQPPVGAVGSNVGNSSIQLERGQASQPGGDSNSKSQRTNQLPRQNQQQSIPNPSQPQGDSLPGKGVQPGKDALPRGDALPPSPGGDELLFQGGTDDDQELFRRAVSVQESTNSTDPENKSTSNNSKVAFLFLTRWPLPLAPLWARFFAGHEGRFSIYVHASQEIPKTLPSVFKGSIVPSKTVAWGEISIVDAERRLLANALLDPSNTRFVLVSESCIPLFNFTFTHSFLTSSDLSFVRVIEDPHRRNRNRWNRHFLPLIPYQQWQKGGQWFAITREVAKMVVGDTTYYPLFRDFCVPDCYADEHYISTMLTIIAPERIANQTLTWTDWSLGGWHPSAFGKGRISEKLIGRIRGRESCDWSGLGFGATYCHLFARKFKPDALDPLLALSWYLGF